MALMRPSHFALALLLSLEVIDRSDAAEQRFRRHLLIISIGGDTWRRVPPRPVPLCGGAVVQGVVICVPRGGSSVRCLAVLGHAVSFTPNLNCKQRDCTKQKIKLQNTGQKYAGAKIARKSDS